MIIFRRILMLKKMFLCLPFFVVVSCSDDKKSDNNNSTGSPTIEGVFAVYETGCIADGEKSSKEYLNFADKSFINVIENFSDLGCKTAETTSIFEVSTQQGLKELLSKSGTQNIDAKLEKLSLTPKIPTLVSILNQEKVCGFSDWAINTSKDISGLTCGEGQEKNPAKGSMIYTIVKVEGNNLSLGDSDQESLKDGTTPEKRHAEFAKDVFIKK
jgi:hypothetical protein